VPAKLAAMTGPLLLNCAISREVRGDWVDFFFGVRSSA
jgi:hypothetical protein